MQCLFQPVHTPANSSKAAHLSMHCVLILRLKPSVRLLADAFLEKNLLDIWNAMKYEYFSLI